MANMRKFSMVHITSITTGRAFPAHSAQRADRPPCPPITFHYRSPAELQTAAVSEVLKRLSRLRHLEAGGHAREVYGRDAYGEILRAYNSV